MARRTKSTPDTMSVAALRSGSPTASRVHPPVWLAAVILAGAIFAVYGRSLDVPFVLDDRITIVENPSITSLWPLVGTAEAPGPLRPRADLTTSARPLVNLTFALNYWADGINTAGYHLVNVLLHFLNALLLWAIVRRTLLLPRFEAGSNCVLKKGTGSRSTAAVVAEAADHGRAGPLFQPTSAGWLALAVALLWAVHPLQTEAVIYVTQRTELMVAFFYLATLYCSLKYWAAADFLPLPPYPARTERTSPPLPSGEGRGEGALATATSSEPNTSHLESHARTTWLILATLACLCGMASKEVMVSAPLMILLYERVFVANSLGAAIRRSWPLYVCLASTWILLIALNMNSPRGASAGFHLGISLAAWWLTQCKVLLLYLKLAIWPAPLLLHYELPYLHSLSEGWMYVLPVALLAIVAIVLLVRNRILGFLLAFMAAILAPTFVVPVVTEMAAERRMYLPLAALIALLVVGIYLACQKWLQRRTDNQQALASTQSLRATVFTSVILALVCGVVSAHRHYVYRDDLLLWQQVIDNQPSNYKAHYNLGLELNRVGREAESLAELQAAVTANPNFPDARSALGFALINAGRVPEAIDMLNAALALEPNHAAALNNLGIAYMRLGDLPKAIENLKHAIQIAPKLADAHHNLGRALASNGQVDEALQELQAAAALAPNDLDILNDFAMLLAASGRRPQAIELTQRILENRPDFAAAHHGLAMMLYESSDVRGSIDHFQRYLQLKPNDAGAMCNLASVLATQGDYQNAAALCEQAVKLAPSLPEAHFGLGTSLVKLGQLPEAIEQFQQVLKLRPNYFAAHIELANALAAAGRHAEALQTAEQGLAAARSANDAAHAAQLEAWLKENKR